jgi:hypothetical protein
LEPLRDIPDEEGCDHPMTTGEDTLKRECEGHDMSQISEHLRANVMAKYE